ncbi:MAG: hypothetical protein DRP02_13435 [Candidatus Gerdarchaeota archaeon]|nr:MAG: hypothetical protein DRP02_13435 [Candidatus Gerdarchaeota archaeon]
MLLSIDPLNKDHAQSFDQLFGSAGKAMIGMTPLEARGDRPLQMTLEDQLRALVFFHLQEHTSAQHLLQVLQEDDFARSKIAPEKGIRKSSFSEATNSRGLEQFMYVFKNLQAQAEKFYQAITPILEIL